MDCVICVIVFSEKIVYFFGDSKMKSTIVLVTVLVIMVFGSVVMAAGVDITGQSCLNQGFDFGDVHGNYSTDLGGSTFSPQFSANFGVSNGVITSNYTYVQLAPWLNQLGKNFFQVVTEFSGNYDSLPAMVGDVSQSLSSTHKGVSISESAGLNSYQQYRDGDISTPTGAIWNNAYSYLQISPFTVTNAQGNFNDWSWTDQFGLSYNDFSYSVRWTGYTTNSSAAGVFGSIQPMNLTAVPEPGMVAIFCSAIGFILYRRKNVKPVVV